MTKINLDKMVVEIKADLTHLKKGMIQSSKILKITSKKMEKNNRGLASSFLILQRRVIALASAYITLKSVSKSISLAGEFEQTQLAMEVMLGSQEKGNKLLTDTIKLSQKSPFSFKEAVTGTKRLLAMGIETEKVTDTLRMLGDISAGIGREKLPYLILAFSQVKAKGKLMAEELNRQFSEAGVPLLDALTKTLNKSEQEILKMITLGKVSFNDVEVALQSLTTGSGKFANMMELQSKTYLGTLEKVKEKFDIIQIKLGTKMLPLLKKLLNILDKITEKYSNLELDKRKTLQKNIESTTIKIEVLTKHLEKLKNKTMDWGKVMHHVGDTIKSSFTALKGGVPVQKKYISIIEKTENALSNARKELEQYQNQLIKLNEKSRASDEAPKKSLADLMNLSVKASQTIRDAMISATNQWSEHLTDAILKGENMLNSLAEIAKRIAVQTLVTDPFISSLQKGLTNAFTPTPAPSSAPPLKGQSSINMNMNINNNNTFNPNVAASVRAEIETAAPYIQAASIAGVQAALSNGKMRV